jgi:hypothetical protein
MIRWAVCALLAVLPAGGLAAAGVDYAESRHAGLWLQHPVYGGPSFDAFVHAPHNPLHRGAPPFEWPVNSFFFADPVSGHWYVYVGDYCEGYAARPSRCVLLRSTDRGQSWTNLGVVLQGSKEMFDQGGHTPDVSVVYAGGRYHMVYDWVEPDWSQLGGLAYAWAEKPEGPFRRAQQPITRNKELTPLLGRYQRTYAATLLRRKHDWMIVGMMDHAPNSWALFAMTAPNPEGPYGERVLLRNVEADGFHPPLLEFYPAFVHRGFVYAPATSVALNRNYNALFRAPLERAAEPGAWELVQNGAVWHAEDVENEAYGLWGQTFSGWVDGNGVLQAAFQSRDPKGMGTVNLAARPWNQPLRKSGFVMSGHQGPSLTLLRRAFAGYRLDARLRVRGTARLLVDYDGVLGPNRPDSDATLHPLALSRCDAVELTEQEWKVVRFGQAGEKTVLAFGARTGGETVEVALDRKPGGETSRVYSVGARAKEPQRRDERREESEGEGAQSNHLLVTDSQVTETGLSLRPSRLCGLTAIPSTAPLRVSISLDGRAVWTGELPPRHESGLSLLGIAVEPHSHLVVEKFTIQGKPQPAVVNYLFTEAILGAGGNAKDWQELHGPEFRYGLAAVSKAPGARVKWNVEGGQFLLWSPRGPEFGKAQVKVDGRVLANIDLHAERLIPSQIAWKSPRLKVGCHAIALTATDGLLVVDSIEVTR